MILVPLFLLLGRYWQNDVRDLMGMDRWRVEWIQILGLGLVVALIVLLIARLVRGFHAYAIRLIDRIFRVARRWSAGSC